MNKAKYLKYSLLASGNLFAAWVISSAASIHYFTRRDRSPVEALQALSDKPIEDVSVVTDDGVWVSGWLIDNDSDKVVILLSGRGSNRNANIKKAQIYIERGYSVLMPDLRATGRSDGHRISFGWYERKDIEAWYRFLQSKKYKYIAAHGYSIGAATICYSLRNVKGYDFVVLESCYRDLFELTQNTLRRTYLPQTTAYLIKPMTEYLLRVVSDKLRPEIFLERCKAPLLMMGGDSETLVPAPTTIELFVQNKARFSKLHLFKGAIHENFSINFPEEYKKVLTDFLQHVEASHEYKHLRRKQVAS